MERVHTETALPPELPAHPDLVRRQLERILAGPHFRTSKRCSDFLRFVVEQTLEGHQRELKERNVGVAVFGRALDYETPVDPIVRVKANEVRKRLAQHYSEAGPDDGLHILLPSGAYIPEFQWTMAPPVLAEMRGAPHRLSRYGIAACVVVLIAAGGIYSARVLGATPQEQFWEPVIHHAGNAIISSGTGNSWAISRGLAEQIERVPADAQGPVTLRFTPGDAVHLLNWHVSTGQMNAILGISSMLAAKGKTAEIRRGSELTAEDVASHPVIAIGAFSNPWTIRKNAELRFEFEGDGLDEKAPLSIRDRANPTVRWTVTDRFPWKKQTVDYAIISRVTDAASGNVFITLAGINTFGTQAAHHFLTKPRYWEELARTAPAGWQKKNLQIVLETTVVENTPSPPKVLATHFW